MKTKKGMPDTRAIEMTFDDLVETIRLVDKDTAAQVGRAVNIGLTLRNWFIGCYVALYELKGADRGKYGDRLMPKLAERLGSLGVCNCNRRQLYDYLQFHRAYPQIVPTPAAQLPVMRHAQGSKTAAEKVPTVSAQLGAGLDIRVRTLSYSMFRLLVDLDNDDQRVFYETECLQGNWSVRELKRQIASLYYERSGLSRDKKKLAARVRRESEQAPLRLDVRDPYIFEFLGLKPREIMGESHLEDQLLDKLQDFLLELGHGFCFEARQKRILIGNTYGFVDLVFYHRILRCHVLIDLKLEAFCHENIGQLNTYVTWYRKHMMAKGDNPPVGILLCAHKDHALAEYALAGMANKLFVSKYQLHLPNPEQLRRQLERAIEEKTT
jgi:predicted nuclease of restriction endonuclease-like (RecB) superfamily